MIRPAAAVLGAFLAACPAGSVAAQETDAGPAASAPEATIARRGRVPLLPEGVRLVGAIGTAEFDAEDGIWIFRPNVSNADLARELVLMPGEVRSDLAEAAAARGGPRAFAKQDLEIHGVVHAHRGRNYLRASAVNLVETPAAAAVEVPPRDSTPPSVDSEFLAEDDLVAQLEAELEARTGRAPRSVAVSDSDAPQTAVEEYRLQRRRGHLRRDVLTGVPIFVPEADGTGSREGPYELLPCEMLERIEALALRSSTPRIVTLSGLAIVEGPRRFLLPTRYAIPREGKGIRP
ncbi:MAG: hypothetical protein ACO3P9_01265 [Phycisphaerales bacterium]|jgi:hypothetical protein